MSRGVVTSTEAALVSAVIDASLTLRVGEALAYVQDGLSGDCLKAIAVVFCRLTNSPVTRALGSVAVLFWSSVMQLITLSELINRSPAIFEIYGQFREDDPYYLDPFMGLRFLKDTSSLTLMQADACYKEGYIRYNMLSIKIEDRSFDVLTCDITKSGEKFLKKQLARESANFENDYLALNTARTFVSYHEWQRRHYRRVFTTEITKKKKPGLIGKAITIGSVVSVACSDQALAARAKAVGQPPNFDKAMQGASS